MSKGYKAGGSGRSELAFKVAAYASKSAMTADTPVSHTIGIITTTNITEWSIGPEKPASPKSGMLWIESGTKGNAFVNALKRNAIEMYLVSAAQYISGAWKSVEAYLHKGVSWMQFGYITLFLYKNGDRNLSVTGNFYYGSTVISDGVDSGGTRYLDFPSPPMEGVRDYSMRNKVDLTPFRYLVAKGIHGRAGGPGDTVRILGSDGSIVAYADAAATGDMQTIRIDVSGLNAEYSLQFHDYGNGYDNWDLYELYLTNE